MGAIHTDACFYYLLLPHVLRSKAVPRPNDIRARCFSFKCQFKCAHNIDKMDCPNSAKFCLVCGQFTPKNFQAPVTGPWRQKYESLFTLAETVREWYAPQVACNYCRRGIDRGGKETTDIKVTIKFSAPAVWHPQDEHVPERCYFCVANVEVLSGRHTWKTRDKIDYPFHLGVTPPTIRTDFRKHSRKEEFDQESDEETVHDPDFYVPPDDPEDNLFDFTEFQNLVRVLDLPTYLAEFLASVLKGKGFTTKNFLVTAFRDRKPMAVFDSCFAYVLDSGFIYCKDVERLFYHLNHPYKDDEWRLFVDSSKRSLKAVLVHIGNKLPSVPLLYATETTEDLQAMERILRLLDYPAHNWKISADLKIVAVLMGLKPGYCRMQCYMCKWEGRKDNWHYTEDYEWEARDSYEINEHDSIVYEPLVDPANIIIPPLHVKLGLVKNFIKAISPRGKDYLEHFFPKLSVAKIEEGN